MKTALIVFGSVVTVAAALPYILDILKKKSKPRVVSWFTWAVLTAISAAASASDHQWPAAVLSMSATLECLAIVLLGLKYGDRSFGRFDISCQVAAIIGLILWWAFNSPGIAIIASIIIDLIAALPTYRHAWQKPREETWITYALSGLGALLILLAVSKYKVTSAANPVYLIIVNFAMTAEILMRRKTNPA